MKNFLVQNGVDISALKPNKNFPNKVEKAMKPVSENEVGRKAQGKIISDVAKANNVELSPTLENGVKLGMARALKQAQAKLQDVGVLPSKNNKNQQSKNTDRKSTRLNSSH